MKKLLGLYLHIPFCVSKCLYCDFSSIVSTIEEKEKYISALISQMKFWSGKIKHRVIDTVYIGGGTPTSLGEKLLCKLIGEVYNCFNISENAEFTIEANPESADFDILKGVFYAGANRISIGAQSFCDNELILLGRAHSSKDIKSAVDNAKRAGFSDISLDLMFGIPEQTLNSLEISLNEIIGQNPCHISTYALKIEEGTPFHSNKNLNLPDEDNEDKMYRLICDKLKDNGYIHYEISNFAKYGCESKHNLKYWRCGEYLGLGAAGHSYIDNERFCYTKDINLYISECEKGEVKPLDIQKIDDIEKANEYIMLGLRLKEGVRFDKIIEFFGDKNIPQLKKEINALCKSGFCVYTKKGFALTEKGFWLSNSIIARILKVI